VRDAVGYHVMLVEEVARWAHEFDIVHFHIDHYHLPTFCRLDVPFVTTLHGRLDLPELQPLFRCYPKAPFISISQAQRRPVPFTHWAGTVQHGLPEHLLPASPRGGPCLAFLGRISPEKGPGRAIRIAQAAGKKLKIAAKIDRVDRDYFEEAIRPFFDDPLVEYVGEISDHEKAEFLGGAAALLFPIDWPEPFGLVMIEAMACGTPVIAFNRGAVPEVVEDGVSGFIVEDELGALAAIRRLSELDRGAVRAAFERRFTAGRMAEDHVAIYRRLAAQKRGLRLVGSD
jgi:glycosyltransferase involved in cell wall biosynthesis